MHSGSLHIALNALKTKRHLIGLVFAGLALAFLINAFYVATSRTQLVVFPFLGGCFRNSAFWVTRSSLCAQLTTGAVLPSLWFTSPYLRGRVIDVVEAVQHSQAGDPPASAANELQISTALHLSFLKKSLQFVEEAPLIGHGTGSITELYRRSAVGQTGTDATISTNPHNQTFAVAIQLGVLGVIVLYAMWISHARLMFAPPPGQEGWIGFLLSFKMSYPLCLTPICSTSRRVGPTYVFGVGIIGGFALQRRQLGQGH